MLLPMRWCHLPKTGLGRGLRPRFYSIRDRNVIRSPEPDAAKLEAEADKRLEDQALAFQNRIQKKIARSRKPFPAGGPLEPDADKLWMMNLDPPTQPKHPRGLEVALIGPSNAGKSTLVNRMCLQKVSAVSSKAQTTREVARGIFIDGDTEVILQDTPGIITGYHVKRVAREICIASWNAIEDAEASVCVVDAIKTIDQGTIQMLRQLQLTVDRRRRELPDWKSFLFLNKIDKTDSSIPRKRTTTPLKFDVIGRFVYRFPPLHQLFDKVLVGSALTGLNVDGLKNELVSASKPSPWVYGYGVNSDRSKLGAVHEIIKEKIFRHLNREMPYLVGQETFNWMEDPDNNTVRLDHKLFVDRLSQLKILIGKNGSNISAIRLEAIRDLQMFLKCQVDLRLYACKRKSTVRST